MAAGQLIDSQLELISRSAALPATENQPPRTSHQSGLLTAHSKQEAVRQHGIPNIQDHKLGSADSRNLTQEQKRGEIARSE